MTQVCLSLSVLPTDIEGTCVLTYLVVGVEWSTFNAILITALCRHCTPPFLGI